MKHTADHSTNVQLPGVRRGDAIRGGRTPEELEGMLEDALVVGDRAAMARLFEARAVLVVDDEPPACGGEEIAQATVGRAYVADPRRVIQARDLALIVADGATNVARRGDDGAWRYVIAYLRP